MGMSDSLQNLPVFKPDSFSRFVPLSQCAQNRVTYVSTSPPATYWVVSHDSHFLHDISFAKRRMDYQSMVTNPSIRLQTPEPKPSSFSPSDHAEEPALKMPRIAAQ
ncbi:hypothetical protein CSKR_203370 [Clonorchis sinensis]|nr:hypothetical protein CSKR_203370 [Clonorchis sinensis]